MIKRLRTLHLGSRGWNDPFVRRQFGRLVYGNEVGTLRLFERVWNLMSTDKFLERYVCGKKDVILCLRGRVWELKCVGKRGWNVTSV